MEEERREWEDFLKYAHIFSPGREEQFLTILSLIPASQEDAFTFVDLGCGGGQLSAEILKKFPKAKAVCIDKTEESLKTAKDNLKEFGDRIRIRQADFGKEELFEHIPDNVRCIVSSLALHHLGDREKQELFKRLYNKFEQGGALLAADIMEPVSEQAREYYANLYDDIVKQQSQEKTGSLDVYDRFREIEWNYYEWDEEDRAEEEDTPSRLFDQLKWLEEAGFSKVDCFWLRAGHAVYGGYK